MRRFLIPVVSLLACLGYGQEIQIRMMAGGGYGIPPKEATATTTQVRRAVFEEFHRQNPGIRVVNAGGLSLADGSQADNMFLMSMAGDSAPDIFYVNFRQYYTFLEQGFARPLDDLIAKDPDVMSRVNPTVMKVLKSFDGKVYAVPFFQVALALYFRKDHFQQAGLDPHKPPKNWDEFYAYAQKLSQVKKGRFGFAFSTPPGYHWQNFLYQAGGEVVAPTDTGIWQSRINSPEAVTAVNYFRKLVVDKWKNEKGEMVGPACAVSSKFSDDVRMGNTSMWFSYTNDVVLQNNGDLPPSLIGIAALPAGPAGPSNEINAGMWAINAQVKDPKKLEACWKFIKFFAGDQAARINTTKMVELGMGNLVNPTWLKKFGYEEYLADIDPSYIQVNEEQFKTGHPEPYGKNCQQVYSVLDQALDDARLHPDKDAREILAACEKDMNQKLLGYIPPDVLHRQRIWAMAIFSVIALLAAGFTTYSIRKAIRNRAIVDERLAAGTKKARIYSFMAFCLMPATLSILIWAYYPLARGLVIAFQDYKITQGAKWVGLDNFIGVFSQPVFYQSLWNSFVYVFLMIVIGFFLPIFLALALNEIPRGKVFFRTVFYLPAMTSSIVIAFLWKQFYDKTDQGLLNVILGPVIEHVINPVRGLMHMDAWPVVNDWLGNPSLAIFAVVIPGIWAGAGPGSILYLAALKNISEDRYEAADLDGANWWQKIRHITLPGLKPLILINLLGVFIAGFKAMENIFVLTQGGPLNSTRTIGLEVWQNAFMYLKFGYATAAAWVMGAILIGFTLVQIRSLLKMRFTTAKA
ncbi:MAG: hypothetical protein BGO01_11000 [Armatimonadetes bacterium 55-13]|nr:extracellular solute-binding protein [Armatimonadota bacterium]OJU62915.1 MAG: hypothetical protein BGO01_11000 [Armatimonadetes bacterium 55-13]